MKTNPKSVHSMIEEARAIIIAVSAAAIGAELVTDDVNFRFSPEVQRDLLGKANALLLDAQGEVEA